MRLREAWWQFGVVALLLTVAAHADQLRLRVTRSASLEGQPIARDILWAGPGEVYIALGKNGVLRASLALTSHQLVVPPASAKHLMAGRIGRGGKHLVFSSPVGGFSWLPFHTGPAGELGTRAMAVVTDVDARGDRVAVLGAEAGPVTGVAADGTIAWTGSLTRGLHDMRPLMKGRARPGGKDMARCSFLETGAIRFMRDGSVVVAPGVEPGVYQYDESGKLLHAWDTAQLGILDECPSDIQTLRPMRRDVGARSDWLAAHVVLDDILPLRSGPALLLRRVERGVSRWDLVTLPRSGRPSRVEVPITVPSPRGHLRGDVQGNLIVMLAFDDPLPGRQPVAPQRVVVLTME